MKQYTPQDWFNLTKELYDLMVADIEKSNDTLATTYPKLVVMYEFFRLVRGEAFLSSRPVGIGKFQSEIYAMEDDLAGKLKALEVKLDGKDGEVKYNLDLMKKSFSLRYFNHEQ
jgi:hypothetical protein